MTYVIDSVLRECAEGYIEDLRACLRQDTAIYQEHGASAFAKIDDAISVLHCQLLKSSSFANAKYNRQGDLAAGLLILGMEYPQDYAQLMASVVRDEPVRSFKGVCWLSSVLGALADDHDYVLIRDELGNHRLVHESSRNSSEAFVPLTCARDFAEIVISILSQKELSVTPHEAPGVR
jgi:hypothetical protein